MGDQEKVPEAVADILARPSEDESVITRKQSERYEFLTAVVRELCELYRAELTAELVILWQRALADLSDDAIRWGKAETVRSHKDFMPTPAQFREYVEDALSKTERKGHKHEGCEACQGTGWRVVPRPDGMGNWAKRCDWK